MIRTNVPLISVTIVYSSYDCFKVLVENWADIEQEDGSGYRPIHWACLFGQNKMLTALLEAGANPEPKGDPSILSPLLIASKSGFIECVSILLAHGVDVNQQDGTGRSALHITAWFEFPDIAELLLRYQAKISLPDLSGHVPLHLACWFGQIKTCEILIKHHAPIDAQDSSGRTPLHFACQHNHLEIVKMLLQAGANVKLKNTNGKTPEAIAAANDRITLVELLQNYSKTKETSTSKGSEKPFEIEIVEEMEKTKKLIAQIQETRNRQSETIDNVREKVELHHAAIITILQNQKALIEQTQRIQAVLNSLTHEGHRLSSSNSGIGISSSETGSQIRSNLSSDNSLAPVCRRCESKLASFACKKCRAPFCDTCAEITKGCPFCKK